jgi:hypothetical protein
VLLSQLASLTKPDREMALSLATEDKFIQLLYLQIHYCGRIIIEKTR